MKTTFDDLDAIQLRDALSHMDVSVTIADAHWLLKTASRMEREREAKRIAGRLLTARSARKSFQSSLSGNSRGEAQELDMGYEP